MKLSSNHASRGITQDLLDKFWGLAEAKDETRIDSAEQLVTILKGSGAAHDNDEVPEDVKYVVTRLIRGLSSSRKCARPGFAMALTEVIRRFSLDAGYIVSQINNILKLSKKDSKREQGHTRMAQALGYLALMRAGQLPKVSGQTLKDMTETLVKLRTDKQYLNLLGLQALCILIEMAQPKKFHKYVSEVLAEDLNAGWATCTPDNLLLLIVTAQHQQKAVTAEHLETHWGSKKILSKLTIGHIAELLPQTTACHPLVHPVCYELVNMAVRESSGKLFARFWKHVITEKLICNEHVNKKYLGFQLVTHAMKQSLTADMVSHVMSPELIEVLLRSIVHKSDVLHGAARQLVSRIVEFCTSQTEGNLQLAVLKPLLNPPSSIVFDCVSQTRTVATIVQSLTSAACHKYGDELMMVLLREGDFCSGKDEMSLLRWAGSQLVCLLTVPSVCADVPWQSSVLQFLMLHSFFELTKPLPNVKHCHKAAHADAEQSAALRDIFYKALSTLASCYPDKRHAKHEYIAILHDTISYATQILENSPATVRVLKPLTEEEQKLWSTVLSTVREIQEQKSSSESLNNKNRAFQMLSMLFGLHLFLPDTKETVETLQELEVCYAKSKKVSKDKSSEEPEWIEVITELLVSLMSKSSHLLRSVSGSVFAFLQPFLTKKALDIILEVFIATGEGEEEAVAFEDDDDDDTGALCNGDKEHSESSSPSSKYDSNDESADESSNASDVSDVEEETSAVSDGGVDPSLRAAVKAALGRAAADIGGNEDSMEGSDGAPDADEDDVSDTEMFRLDGALAAAFKSMKRHGPAEKERSKQLLHFKLRCLDLLEQLVKEGARTDLMVELLIPLLVLLEAGVKDKEQKILGDRAMSLYHKLCKLKKVKALSFEVKRTLPGLLKQMIDLSTRMSGVPMVLEVSSGCLFVLRAASDTADACASPQPTTGSSKSTNGLCSEGAHSDCMTSIITVVQDSLNEYLTQRESRLSHFVFQHMFERQGLLFWPLHRTLLASVAGPEVRIFCRTQACSMLSLLLHKNIVSVIGVPQWAEFICLLKETLATALCELSVADNFKPRYVQELLSMVCKCRLADSSLIFDLSKLDEVKHVFTKPIKKLHARATADKCDKVHTNVPEVTTTTPSKRSLTACNGEQKPLIKRPRH